MTQTTIAGTEAESWASAGRQHQPVSGRARPDPRPQTGYPLRSHPPGVTLQAPGSHGALAEIPLRVALVHHDPPSRRKLLRMLARLGQEVVAECGNAAEAVERVPATRPDLLYLEVPAAGMDGLQVLEALGPHTPPVVIFISSREDYAIHAYESQVADYLLEPVSEVRFLRSLRRAEEFLAGRRAMDQVSEFQAGAPIAHGGAAEPVHWMLVESRGASIPLPVAEISWIEADDNYVRLHAQGQTYLVRESMARILRRLDPKRFVRIHRSVIVNMEAVKELRPTGTGDDVVVLKDGTTVRMSRRYAKQLGSAVADYR